MNRYAGIPNPVHAPEALSPHSFQPSALFSRLFAAWLQDMGNLQKQLLAFCNQRMEKDASLMERLTECTSPGAWLDLQAELLAGMAADHALFGQRLLALFGDAMQRQWALAGKAAQPPAHP